jgi:hypothetical protein
MRVVTAVPTPKDETAVKETNVKLKTCRSREKTRK